MTSTLSELELIETLDFEHEESCQWSAGCDEKPVMLFVKTCCGVSYAECEKHTVVLKAFINHMGNTLTCKTCDAGIVEWRLVPL